MYKMTEHLEIIGSRDDVRYSSTSNTGRVHAASRVTRF